MTELVFLLDLLLDTKNMSEVKKKCKERIALIQSAQAPIPRVIAPTMIAQAPSTIAALERQMAQPEPSPVPLPKPIPHHIIGGEVNNGDGTRGKRKF